MRGNMMHVDEYTATDINEFNLLLKEIGIDNVIVTESPIFKWNGEEFSDDENSDIKQLSAYMLNKGETFRDFAEKYRGKKIIVQLPLYRSEPIIENRKYLRACVL